MHRKYACMVFLHNFSFSKKWDFFNILYELKVGKMAAITNFKTSCAIASIHVVCCGKPKVTPLSQKG